MKKYWALNGKRHQVPLLAHSVVLPHLKRQNRNRNPEWDFNICEGIEVYALTGEADDIQRHAADPRRTSIGDPASVSEATLARLSRS